jgi:heme exporter protein D
VQRKKHVNLGPHADFIIASYSVAIVIVAALIGWVVADYAAQRRVLRDLKQRGISRRSQRMEGGAP